MHHFVTSLARSELNGHPKNWGKWPHIQAGAEPQTGDEGRFFITCHNWSETAKARQFQRIGKQDNAKINTSSANDR
jgi:hypothetical protein